MANKSNLSPAPAGGPSDLGFYRVPQIIALLSISKSTWWLWVQNGRAPKGHKLSPGVTVWKRSDIHAFIDRLASEDPSGPESPGAA